MKTLLSQMGMRSFLLSATTLFLVGSLGFSYLGMEMEVGGEMSNCPFMASEASICQMSATEHISQWQQTFLGIPSKANFLALALLLAAAVLLTFAKSLSKFKKLTELAAQLFAHHTEHVVKVFDPLLLAFSDGILKPRIYEPKHI